MGVPKFYRWISERYPCLSEIVKDYQIPEFDNLYLDMNGIIHVCSHPNDNDPHFRITEEQIFKDIFHYIEVLFRMIKPQKIFFMAVDGVAPRAKMNQQRGRRFRSAREAEENEKRAQDRGEVLPKEARFDSNCITPGTGFMARLDRQLQYFVTSKISQDSSWQNCTVIYSGHQTPGEGEHKIMEYIRFSRSKTNYDPNTRHCLYGLDADLMMLGLTSHEPHFSLLREEVRFGKSDNSKRAASAEENTFHLLHLSLMREYINYEFIPLKDTLPFPYDLEKLIDDWVLMGFLVGNDFIPHLPNLHISKDALPILFEAYRDVLPTIDGYLNEGGTLNLERFEKFMERLTEFDLDFFSQQNADLSFLAGKQSENGYVPPHKTANSRAQELEPYDFGNDCFDDNEFKALEQEMDDEEFDVHCQKKLETLGISNQDELWESDESDPNMEFRIHKNDYYRTKMKYDVFTPEDLKDQALNYVRGLQWILHYYYNGICSWSWFYPFHYAPYISDIKNFSHVPIQFDKGKPFLPFEQLLGVLPPASKIHLPAVYHTLMTHPHSSLIQYYPTDFATDLNGKLQEWEAVVLIPFIDENKLLDAMKPLNDLLTNEERNRNCAGPMYVYNYTTDSLGEYKAPGHFPPIINNHANCQHIWREEWDMRPSEITKGLIDNKLKDMYFRGFSTLRHIEHTFRLGKEEVKVFQQNSRGENYILMLNDQENYDIIQLGKKLLGNIVFVCWPHLVEAKVEKISDRQEEVVLIHNEDGLKRMEKRKVLREDIFHLDVRCIKDQYHNRWGVDIGTTKVVIYAKQMSGQKYVPNNNGEMILVKEWSHVVQPYAAQAVVQELEVNDPGYAKVKSIQTHFSTSSKIFMLANPYYGSSGEVIEVDNKSSKNRIRVSMSITEDPDFTNVKRQQDQLMDNYITTYDSSKALGISTKLFNKITGTMLLAPFKDPNNPFQEIEKSRNKHNIGMNLRIGKTCQEIKGFSHRIEEQRGWTWKYSNRCMEAVQEYMMKFPEVFTLVNEKVHEKDYCADDVFKGEDKKERLSDLVTWLKESEFSKGEKQRFGTLTVNEDLLPELCKEVDKILNIRERVIKMQVKPHLLFKPNPLQGSSPPDPSATYELFDRIVNVREGYSVPLGAKGTIVGIQPSNKSADVLYDVMFDHPFQGGLTRAGPLSHQRCYLLHWATFINISHGLRSGATNNVKVHGHEPGYATNRLASTSVKLSYHVKTQQQQPRSLEQQPKQIHKKNSPNGEESDLHPSKSLSAPQPNQLPMPLELQAGLQPSSSLPSNYQYNHRQSEQTNSNLVVHCTYYNNWANILRNGIFKGSRPHIPCFSYIPNSSRSFQLYIFINVELAVADGIRFFNSSNGCVYCTGDENGILSSKYFLKVLDVLSDKIIFPHSHFNGSGSMMQQQPAPPSQSIRNDNKMHFPGEIQRLQHQNKGRGCTPHLQGVDEPKDLFQNIWAQVQCINPESVSLRPSNNMSLFAGGSNAAIPGESQVENRKEVSVESLFLGAGKSTDANNTVIKPRENVDIMSLLTEASHNLEASKQPVSQPEVAKPSVAANNTSSFIPTQVIRKQTPVKAPIASQGSSTPSAKVLTLTEKKQVSVESTGPQDGASSSVTTKKQAKKPRQSRLAIKFDAK